MKAIRIHRYGGPEALQYDWKVREGHVKDIWPHKLPLILGCDFSGGVLA
jgi:NADPH:quinone reductase-like Zn-dependent oxidoreductase